MSDDISQDNFDLQLPDEDNSLRSRLARERLTIRWSWKKRLTALLTGVLFSVFVVVTTLVVPWILVILEWATGGKTIPSALFGGLIVITGSVAWIRCRRLDAGVRGKSRVRAFFLSLGALVVLGVCFLRTESVNVRLYSVGLLGNFGSTASPLLVQAFRTEESDVRDNVFETLDSLGLRKEILPVIHEWLAVPDVDGSFEPFQYLDKLDDDAFPAVPWLCKYIEESVPEHKTIDDNGVPSDSRSGLEVIAGFGPKASDAVPTIVKLLEQRLQLYAKTNVTNEWDLAEGERELVKQVFATLRSMSVKASPAVPVLVSYLKTKMYRQQVYVVLASIGPPAEEAIPALVNHVEAYNQKSNVAYRRVDTATTALVAIGSDDKAARLIVNELADNKIEEKAVYLCAKMARRSDKAAKILLETASDEGNKAHSLAVDELGFLNSLASQSAPVLASCAKTHKDYRHALEALGRLGPDAADAVPTLIEIVKGNRFRCDEAAWTLSQIGKPAVEALSELLDDDDVSTRWLAADTLRRIGSDAIDAIPALTERLQDDKSKVRVKAAVAIYFIDRTRKDLAIKALVAETEIESIGQMARFGFVEIGLEAVPTLVNLLKHESPDVREQSARSLGDIGPIAVDALPALNREKNYDVSRVARWAISRINGTYQLQRQLELIEKDKRIEHADGVSLGDIKSLGPALEVLRGAMKHENSRVRNWAVSKARGLDARAAPMIPELTHALSDDDERVRLMFI